MKRRVWTATVTAVGLCRAACGSELPPLALMPPTTAAPAIVYSSDPREGDVCSVRSAGLATREVRIVRVAYHAGNGSLADVIDTTTGHRLTVAVRDLTISHPVSRPLPGGTSTSWRLVPSVPSMQPAIAVPVLPTQATAITPAVALMDRPASAPAPQTVGRANSHPEAPRFGFPADVMSDLLSRTKPTTDPRPKPPTALSGVAPTANRAQPPSAPWVIAPSSVPSPTARELPPMNTIVGPQAPHSLSGSASPLGGIGPHTEPRVVAPPSVPSPATRELRPTNIVEDPKVPSTAIQSPSQIRRLVDSEPQNPRLVTKPWDTRWVTRQPPQTKVGRPSDTVARPSESAGVTAPVMTPTRVVVAPAVPAIPVAVTGLIDPTPIHLVRALAPVPPGRMDVEIRPFVTDLTQSTQPSLRVRAATALAEGRYGWRMDIKQYLVRAAETDPMPNVRAHCIGLLSRLGYHESGYLKYLAECRESGLSEVAAAARIALERLTPRG